MKYVQRVLQPGETVVHESRLHPLIFLPALIWLVIALILLIASVIYKSGLLSRHTLEMNRGKVESVDVDQSILGRLCGFGTIIVRGTGGSLEPIRMISDPLTFRSHITAS